MPTLDSTRELAAFAPRYYSINHLIARRSPVGARGASSPLPIQPALAAAPVSWLPAVTPHVPAHHDHTPPRPSQPDMQRRNMVRRLQTLAPPIDIVGPVFTLAPLITRLVVAALPAQHGASTPGAGPPRSGDRADAMPAHPPVGYRFDSPLRRARAFSPHIAARHPSRHAPRALAFHRSLLPPCCHLKLNKRSSLQLSACAVA
jgi:hypothetical protein